MARGLEGWGRPPRWAVVVIAVGLVAVIAGMAAAVTDKPRDPLSPEQIRQLHSAALAANASAAQTSAATARLAGMRVAFLGDSYSAGSGAPPGGGYIDLVAKQEGWKPAVFAEGGTGYTNPGQAAQHEGVFLDRVPAVVADHPELVIVQGSTNDHDPTADVAAAEKVFAALKAGLPNAKILAVGPVHTRAVTIPAQVRDAVASAAKAEGVPFIDAWGWLDPGDPTMWFVDGVHPNAAGHRRIAERLTADPLFVRALAASP